MRKLIMVIAMLFVMLTIQSAEKNVKITEKYFDNDDLIEMKYNGIDGFWLSSYLAGKGAIAINQMNALKQSLGYTDQNFAIRTKELYRMDYINKILIAVIISIVIGGIFLTAGFIAGVVVYVNLSAIIRK